VAVEHARRIVSRLVDQRLENGLRVVMLPDQRTPIVGVSLWYAVGSRHEVAGRSGFAHLFEHMMFQGSANVAKGEHWDLVYAAGGRTNAYTGLDATVYSETLPSHQLELAFWLEADRMRSLGQVLSQATLDNQRDVVKNERRKKVDNAMYGTWEERLYGLCYPPSHPYHHSFWGSDADLDAAAVDDVRGFFAAHYVPNNATMAIVGDVDVEAALAAIQRHFGAIPAGSVPPAPAGGRPRRTGRREEVVDRAPTPKLYVGCRTPPLGSAGFDVADLVTDVLVTGRASRLRERLVRDRQLAQACTASVEPMVDGAALLILEATARSGVEPAVLEAAVDHELDLLADEPPDEAELERVRGMRATYRASQMQLAEERADRLGMYTCLLDEPERFGTEGQRDLVIGSDAVADLARHSLAGHERSHLWFLPDSA
jgi:predicted Zn-dependent peptidase